jgi:AcrR family transcriptional regulator
VTQNANWTRPNRPLRLPAAARHDQLAETALELFAERGYHATAMDDIAEAAGVTKPVLYQHFPSKRLLYLELVENVSDQLRAAVNAAADEATPYNQVLAGFRNYFRFVASRPRAFRLLFGSGARQLEEAAAAIRQVEDDLAGTIAGFIVADVSDAHRTTLGYAVVGLAEVTGRSWVERSAATDDVLDPAEGERFASWLADLAWAGLRSLPPA